MGFIIQLAMLFIVGIVATSGIIVEFQNGLNFPIQLVVTQNNVAPMLLATIPTGGARAYQLPKGFAGNFKHGWGGKGVTLFEISVQTHDANTYYDLSAIDGFNVPMKVYAPDGTRLEALHSSAPDAYLYPTDDTKTHGLRGDGRFVVVFDW
ncbi:unnamed protein product [Adineta steineri]|uniref:Uncharacterized protein n=1 Tax=Adineta steineri TaxID=433720 RepID=A0A816E3J2_9BILA|nr:unnamed protein product [Adineta steineri]CAF1644790.1 unnamed protein product [Adineta steineri]